MESSGSERRRAKRRPLADLTNHQTPLSSSSYPKPKSTANPKPLPAELGNVSPGSSTLERRAPNPPSSSSAPGADDRSDDPAYNECDHDKSATPTISTRQKPVGRNFTRKAVLSVTSSCPLLGRTKTTRRNFMVGDEAHGQHITSSEACLNSKKRRKTMNMAPGKPMLPKDFVDKQRAYFAEVDAFELPEEEVSESELQ